MNISSRLLALFTGLILLVSSGCQKETSYFPSQATLNDFSGTWTGTLSAFKNNQVITKEGTMTLYFPAGSDRLEGIMVLDKTYALKEIQIRSGIYYFQVLNSDTLNPYCQNWNLSGWGQLNSASEMHVIISGKECGEVGDEWVNYEGDFRLTSYNPDSTQLFSFAEVNRHWTYRVYTAGGDSCQMDIQVDAFDGSAYSGLMTNTCNLTWDGKPMRWSVSGLHFAVLDDHSGSKVQYAFHNDQLLNKQYYYFFGSDTNVVTRLGTDSLYVDAGGFLCTRYKLEQYMHTDSSFKIDKGVVYISNQYGWIRYQATLINEITDILDQELISKNF